MAAALLARARVLGAHGMISTIMTFSGAVPQQGVRQALFSPV